jgi:hypothetical protein
VDDLALRLRTRLLPAVLAALGVALLTAGLLSYTTPVEAGPEPSQEPTIVTLAPTPTPFVTHVPNEPTPTPQPTPPADRVATRVVVKALGIDLPIIKQPTNSTYPLCDVAMYLEWPFPPPGQPGFGRATYLFAHARTGMFLPILTASKINNGAKMLGMEVQVYTSDDQLFVYEITEVRRHQLDIDAAVAATTEQLWLQTSEGPKGTRPKTQVVAQFVSSGPADDAAAHPDARPRVCA